uniref:C-C motif chemokine 5 isoform X1 n=1 Tax=Halichoerus grypus TaxID=9711 RepID=UPI0016591880|nr:C-C motif chemokine 5 isoform X1 [Halichoerus grypus]
MSSCPWSHHTAGTLSAQVFCPQDLHPSRPDASDTTPCCFAYISRRLPYTHIQEYFYTSSKCSIPAVVFVTRKHRQVCADPQKKWVRDHINSLEMS